MKCIAEPCIPNSQMQQYIIIKLPMTLQRQNIYPGKINK